MNRRLFACGLAFAAATTLSAQRPPSAHIVGVGNFIHVVGDVERAIAFYRDVLGLESPPAPSPGPRPFLTTPEIVRLYDATGGRYRTANAGVAGSPMRVELIEWADVERVPVAPRYDEPGAGTLVVTVRDIAATLGSVKASGAPIVTAGEAPVRIVDPRGPARAAIVRDPDGFYVQLVQLDSLPPSATAAATNAFEIGFAVTVDDLEQTLTVFRDALGFQTLTDPETKSAERLALMGVPSATYRRATTVVPGTALHGEFIEVRHPGRRRLRSRPQDPGAAVLRLLVGDMPKAVDALGTARIPVVSTGGQPVTLTNPTATQHYAILRLPDNLFLQLVQRIPR